MPFTKCIAIILDHSYGMGDLTSFVISPKIRNFHTKLFFSVSRVTNKKYS